MKRQRLSSTVLLPVVLLAVVPGCAPVKARQTTLQSTYTTAVQADVISTGTLSQLTLQTLQMAGLQTAAQDSLGTFQAFDQQHRTDHDRNTQLALVELALWHALQQDTTQPDAAADWYFLAAARSYEALFAETPNSTAFFDPCYDRLRLFYARAVAGFLQQVQRSRGSLTGHQRAIAGERYVVDIASGPGLFDPTTFDELLLAAEYIFEGLTNRHRRFGFGISLIGFRPNTLEQPADHSFPKAGLSRAVTGLVLFETPGPGEVQERVVHMCFYDALQVETIEINGGSRPAGG